MENDRFDALAAEARDMIRANGEDATRQTLTQRFLGLVQDDRERVVLVIEMMVEGVIREAQREGVTA